jgi:hypothetical protein
MTNEMSAHLAARVLDHIKRQPHQPVAFLDDIRIRRSLP